MTEEISSFLEELTNSSYHRANNLPSSPNQEQRRPPGCRRMISEGGSQSDIMAKRSENPSTSAPRRSKYIPRACQDCQRRKVKCSGEDVCTHCRHRKVSCVYSSRADGEPSRKRSRTSPSQTTNSTKGQAMPGEVPSPESDDNQSVEDIFARLQDLIQRSFEDSNSGTGDFDTQSARRKLTSSNIYAFDSLLINTEDTDTFDNGAGGNNLSLSAQLLDLQKFLKIHAGITSKCTQIQLHHRVFPLELPSPMELQRLLRNCFRELGSFFPFLDQNDTESRAFRSLEGLGYSEYNLIVDVDTHSHAIMALLCNLLALGESYDFEAKGFGSGNNRPGWAFYQRGKRLVQHCGSSRIFDIDLVRSHTLCCIYMMNSELLVPASHILSTSVQIAMMLKLNDQSQWGKLPEVEMKARQRLWWTIYFLDRRLSQRNGAPYMIRDHDVAVADFHREHIRPLSQMKQTQAVNSLPSANMADSDMYLQSLVDFGRLWGHIWDTSYAALASKDQDWKETIMTDARIYIFRNQLPPELSWDTDKIQSYLENGEEEPHIRRRLAIFIRTNLLRMIIRQNPVLSRVGNEEAKLSCAQLSRSSVEAIEAFSNACSGIHACGYFISTALVECVYHVVYILQDQTTLQTIDRRTLLDTFLKAYELLTDFSASWPTARRAIQALSRSIFSGNDAGTLFSSISKSQTDSGIVDCNPITTKNAQNLKNAVDLGLSGMANFDPAIFPSEAPSLTEISHDILHGDNGILSCGLLGGADAIDFDYTNLFPTS